MSVSERLGRLLACIALLFLVLVVTDTYSKYLTEAAGTTNISIARWRILVNSQDIRNNADLSQVITPTFYADTNIATGIIAPRSRGYFDISIDCQAADVSFEYEIEMSPNSNSSVTDLVATGYSVDGGNTIALNPNQNIVAQVPIANNPGTIEIRVYIEWFDSEGETMNNAADTAATKTGTPAKLDVNLSFTQIADNNNNSNPSPDPNEPDEP